MAVQYSPLCDTDLAAYLAYCFGNGSDTVRAERVGGEAGGQGVDSGSGYDGGDDGGLVGHGDVARSAWLESVSRYKLVSAGIELVSGRDGFEQLAARWFSGSAVGDGVRGVVGDVGTYGASGRNSQRADPDRVSDGSSGQEVLERRGVLRGKWYEHNKNKRARRRAARCSPLGGEEGSASFVESRSVPEWRRKSADGVQVRREKCSDLQVSLEGKWAAENRLAKLRAEQQLQLLEARDLMKIEKMQAAQVLRTTEVCKVQTEKAFASLVKSGDVPGFAETVASDTPSLGRSNGTCISPDSSVSQQEIRQMQKDNLDLQKLSEQFAELHPESYALCKKRVGAKTAFTLDSRGEPEIDADGEVGLDGKFHVHYVHERYDPNPHHKSMDAVWEADAEYGDAWF